MILFKMEIQNEQRKELQVFIMGLENYLYENRLLNVASKQAFDRIYQKLSEVLK